MDRLLASDRFGERWGRHWLDLARYADTRGYVFQRERDFAFSHTYRDYVIRSLNEDRPYDEFLQQQLAADKMKLEDTRDLAGMGLLTLGRNFVGNVHDQIDDRIDVVTRGMLALTVSCARCHEHKYDPIPIEDYYSMYGIFRSAVEPNELPLIEEPDPEDPEYQDFEARVAEKEAELQDYIFDTHVDMLAHARSKAVDYMQTALEMRGVDDTATLRSTAKERELMWQLVESWRAYLQARDDGEEIDPLFEPWLRLLELPDEEFETAAATWHETFLKDHGAALNPLLRAKLREAPKTKDDVKTAYAALFTEADTAWVNLLAATAQLAQQSGEPPVFPEALDEPNLEAFRKLLYLGDSPANVPRGKVENYSDVPTQGQIRNRRNARVRVENTHPGRPDRAMVMQDANKPYDPYVFLRGKPENKGPAVPRRAPLLLATGERAPYEDSGRLQLAEVITDKSNPLTARVMVNRVWWKLFGQGLVSTPSDFGLRSDPPTTSRVARLSCGTLHGR